MRKLIVAGFLTVSASLIALPASAQQNRASKPTTVSATSGAQAMHRGNWGPRVNGRWFAGSQAPGGWSAYRRPVRGFVLPGFWLQPSYYIPDYRSYGLPVPTAGYGWSRYYDDAVLTDQYGRVYDSRIGYDWDRYGGYDDGYYGDYGYSEERRDNIGRVIGGAVIGGVAGGLVGSAIAGPGSRTGGAILGAGVGAIAGGAIADATSPDRHDDRGAGYEPSYDRPAPYARDDRWRRDEERRFARDDERQRKAQAKERARLDKLARKAGYADYTDYAAAYLRTHGPRYAEAPYAPAPHWAAPHPYPAGDGYPRVESRSEPGYVANGYYYPGTTVTTITLEPSVTTTTTTETSYVTQRAKPRPRTKLVKRKIVRAASSCICN